MPKQSRFPEWCSLAVRERAQFASRLISRARRLEPRLHAFVEITPTGGAPPAQGPLNGLPYAAKDLFRAPGHLPRGGLPEPLEGGEGYADVLRRMDAAGAVRIGFTRMTELAYEPSGYNPFEDYPRNAWNPDFIPGGSSSGSGVAVSSGSAVVALGSDTGGSIRIPSHCCGVTGWKPTWGAVSTAGAMPLAPFLDCVGLLARSAADLSPVADILLDHNDPPRSVSTLVVFGDVLRESELPVRQACEDGIDVLRSTGCSTAYVDAMSAIERIDEHALLVMQAEAAQIHALRIEDPSVDAILRKRLAKGLAIESASVSASRAMRPSLVADFEKQILGKADAAILPVMPIRTPPYAEVDPRSPAFSARRLYALSGFCRFVNMLGLPAIAVPVGFDDRGMPVALQLVGRAGRDRDLIELAIRMQKKSDWHGRIPMAIRDLIAEEGEL